METAMDDVAAAQVVYHSIFGTHNEDLGVLQETTNVATNWLLRSQIADKFRAQGKMTVSFKLPEQVFYSKMVQANMTGLLTESSFQIARKQVFAGKRTALYIEAVYKHMSQDKTLNVQRGMTLPALATFRALKTELMTKKDDHPIHGTVEWRRIAGLTPVSHGEEVNLIIRETGRYFCGQS